MKRKLNSALTDIDQRFIEEAALSGGLRHRAPVWLRIALPAAGVAAAAFCIFAAGTARNKGVDLIERTSGDTSVSYAEALPSDTAGSSEYNAEAEKFPEAMVLIQPGKPLHALVMDSDKPQILYADENTVLFTALGRCVYLYDFREGKITQHADAYATLKYQLGNGAIAYQKGNNISFGAMPDGTPIVRYKLENGAVTYAIDEYWSSFKRIDGDYELFRPEKLSDDIIVREKTIFSPKYVKLSDGSCITVTHSDPTIGDDGENGLSPVTLSKFTLDGGEVNYSGHIQPFTEEYLSGITDSGMITSYRFFGAYLDFDMQNKTFELWTPDPVDFTPCGTFAVSDGKIALTFVDGMKYTGTLVDADDYSGIKFSFDEGDHVSEQIAVSCRSVKEFTEAPTQMLFLRDDSVNGGLVELSESDSNRAMEIRNPDGFDSYLEEYITSRMEVLGEEYDEQAADSMTESGAMPLDTEYMQLCGLKDAEPRSNIHRGTDLWSLTDDSAGTVGANVYAFQGGTVILALDNAGENSIGNYIVIDHGNGLATVYASLGEILVTEGQTVEKGEVVARTGISGWSTGEHLHFEIRRNGKLAEPILTRAEPILLEEVFDSLIWPVGGDGGVITELMGGHGGYDAHTGIDISAPLGTAVYAAAPGKVIDLHYNGNFGFTALIDHGGILTQYAHLDNINVVEGQTVSAGDTIGEIGTTGAVVAEPVLHFEVIRGSEDGEKLNPMDFFPERQ